jgi:hypothetical protein
MHEDIRLLMLAAFIGLGMYGWLLLALITYDPDSCYVLATLFR